MLHDIAIGVLVLAGILAVAYMAGSIIAWYITGGDWWA